ncbi:MAG: GntR family transcriptional regulator [Planctomycetota bacterium]
MPLARPPQPDANARTVANGLRGRILAGDWQPGAQLPTWSTLETDFNVARTTLAKAVRQLKRDGFVYSRSTRGMYVSDHPPHLCRYALAFRHHPQEPGWLRFWWALANQATAWNAQAGNPEDTTTSTTPPVNPNHSRIVPFFGVSGPEDSENHRKLLKEVEADRLAGIIFVGHPPEISPRLLEHPWLAKVAITTSPAAHHLPRVFPDRQSFVDRSLQHLAEQHAQRVAVLTNGHPGFDAYDQAITKAGLQSRPHFRVAASLSDPNSAKHIVQLLLDRPADQRPDALIITDDNLVESALAGVLASGCSMPDDLQVVAHCNWPIDTRTRLPITRLGFDAAAVLRAAMQRVEALRHEQAVPDATPVPAVFEDQASAPLVADADSAFIEDPF